MADVIFVGVLCAFFGLCVMYVRWCDRIVGSDPTSPAVGVGDHDADLSTSTVGVPA